MFLCVPVQAMHTADTTAYDDMLIYQWSKRGVWGQLQVQQSSDALCTCTRQWYCQLGSLKLHKKCLVTSSIFFFLSPPRQFLILCLFWNSFSVLPLNCNGPQCYGQGSSCLAQLVFLPSCNCLRQAPGNWSLPPQPKYSHLKDMFSLRSLNAGCLIHKSHYNLAVASEFQSRLHILGCLESFLSVFQLDQKS